MSPISEFKGLNIIVEKNPHVVAYLTVDEYLKQGEEVNNPVDIIPEERALAIKTDTLWSCQFYPDTMVGFFSRSFATFEALEALEAWVASYNADPIKFEVG